MSNDKNQKILARVDKMLLGMNDLTRDEELNLVSARLLLTKLNLSIFKKANPPMPVTFGLVNDHGKVPPKEELGKVRGDD